MVLFQIGVLDITPFIVLGSYQVSNQIEYDTWYDGNRTERRGVKRHNKLKGTFNVKFFDTGDYQTFLSTVKTALSLSDSLEATVYDNKARNTKDTTVYFDFDPPTVEAALGTSENTEITITVTER